MQEVLAFLKSVFAAILAFFMAIYGFFAGLFHCNKPDETTTTTAIVSESDVSSTDITDISDITDITDPSSESTTETTDESSTESTTWPSTTEYSVNPTTQKDAVAKQSLISFGGSDIERFTGSSARSGSFWACGITRSKNGKFSGLISGKFASPYGFITKYNNDGEEIFTIPVYDSANPVYLTDIAVMRKGNAVVCGYIEKSSGIAAFFNVYDTDGNLLIHKVANCSGNTVYNAVAATSDGFVIGGQACSNTGDFEGLPDYTCGILMRFNTDGEILWKRYIGGSKGASVNDLDTDNSNNTYVTLSSASSDGEMAGFDGLVEGSLDNVVIKYDYTGNLKWYKVLSSNGTDNFDFIAADSNYGGCVVGGSYTVYSTENGGTLNGLTNVGGTDSVLFRYDSDGNEKWKRVISGVKDDFISDVVKLDGGYAAVGYSESSNREFTNNYGGYDGFIDVISVTGKQIVCRNLGGSERDQVATAAFNGTTLMAFGHSLSTDCFFEGQNANVTDAAVENLWYDCFMARYNVDLT